MNLTDEVRSLLERVADCLGEGPYEKTENELRTLLAAQPEPQGVELVVDDDVFVDEFMEWWDSEGQFVRAGGREYERSFAFQAWRHLIPKLYAAQHLLSTERAEAERKMAELREERDILQGKLDRFYSQSHGIQALSEIEKLRARVAELEARQVVMPPQCVDRAMPTQYRCGWNSCLAAVARLNPPQANSQEEQQ